MLAIQTVIAAQVYPATMDPYLLIIRASTTELGNSTLKVHSLRIVRHFFVLVVFFLAFRSGRNTGGGVIPLLYSIMEQKPKEVYRFVFNCRGDLPKSNS